MNNYLEPEYLEPYNVWKADPSPQNNATMLQTLQPVIDKGMRMYAGESNPLLQSRARRIALDGLRNYDASRSRLQTHLLNQMQGLRRIARQQSQPILPPERLFQDSQRLRQYEQELQDELGRAPTSAELADRTGLSLAKIERARRMQLGLSEGSFRDSENNSDALLGVSIPGDRRRQDAWMKLVYDDLPPLDQQIMELSLGLYGHRKHSNAEIAKKLNRSPGAISQRKSRIQQLLDQQERLSPF